MAYIKKTAEEVISEMKIDLINNVDEINDANVGSVMDVFLTVLGEQLELQYDDLDLVYNSTRISTADGEDLEELGALVGVERSEGDRATGVVTFIRNSPANSDFTITQGTNVSTQPSTEVEQYSYQVDTNTTFESSISDEEHTFKNGLYEYKLTQRFIDSVSNLTATVSSSPQTLILNSDYSISEDYNDVIIDPSTYEILEDCESAGNWTAGDSADSPTANTSEYYEGAQSLNLLKSGTSTAIMSYNSTLGATSNVNGLSNIWHIFINNSTTLDKISQIQLQYGSDSSNYFYKNFDGEDIDTDWNKLIVDSDDSTVQTIGNPDSGNVDYLKIEITLNNTTDTISSGEILLDNVIKADYENYEGDIILFDKDQTIPDDDTQFSIDYVPLSVEVNVTAVDVGDEYNVQKGKVIYQVNPNPNINRIFNYNTFTDGTDVENDENYRERIQNAGDLANTATVEAIRQNVLALSFVNTVTIEDLPEKTATEEIITYHTGTDKYTLRNFNAIDDSNLTIGDTSGASDYVKDTDFILTDENEIDWSVGGTNPSDNADFYVNYNYNEIGSFIVNVVGIQGSLTTTQLNEVTNLVDDLKSAGVVATIQEPSFISVDVEVTPTIDSNYTTSTVNNNIETAIENYINSRGLGEDILVAGLINVIMDVEGVTNVTIDDIGGGGSNDYTINSDESSVVGTITIN